MLAGLQGSGKTTLAGKLAQWLKGQGHQPLLVAADLQRPNAVTQLQVLGDRAGVEVYAPEPGNGVPPRRPGRVARDSIDHAQAADARHRHRRHRRPSRHRRRHDGAGRRTSATRSQPDEIIFVIDAMVGQDAVATAEAFRDGVGITGVVLSKLDGDARGGAALSVRHVTGEPILFASTGEKLEDFDVFHPDRMAEPHPRHGRRADPDRAGRGRVRRGPEGEDGRQAAWAATTSRWRTSSSSSVAIRRMGPIANLLGMMPGMGQMKDQLAELDDSHFDRITAIIRSMTPSERDEPEDHQRFPAGPHRARLRRHRHGRQPAAQPLRRRAEDDEADGRHDGHARRAARRRSRRRTSARARRAAAAARAAAACRPACPVDSRAACRSCRRASTRPASTAGSRRRSSTSPSSRRRTASSSELPGSRPARLRRPVRTHVACEGVAWRCTYAVWSCPTTRCAICGWSGTGSRSTPVPDAQTVARRRLHPARPGRRALPHRHRRRRSTPITGLDEARALASMDREAGVLAIRDAGSPYPYPRTRRRPRRAATGPRRPACRARPRDICAASASRSPRPTSPAPWPRRPRPATAGSSWSATGSTASVGDLALAWDRDTLTAAVQAAHEAGVRMTAHSFAEESVATLVRGRDRLVEHGTGLSTDVIDEMARRGTALVPTMINIETFEVIAAEAEDRFPGYAGPHAAPAGRFPGRGRAPPSRPACRSTSARTRAAASATVWPRAEMLLLHEKAGMPIEAVLAAGSWGARAVARLPRSGRGWPGRPRRLRLRPAHRPARAAGAAARRAHGAGRR